MPRVTILPVDLTTDVPAGESLLDAGFEVGVSMEAGCCNCSCGTCVVEIVSGMEHLTPAAPQEISVLRVHDRDPARFRLACSARLKGGDVVIRQRR
jgi:ferredoxin